MNAALSKGKNSEAENAKRENERHWVDLIHNPIVAWIILAISLLITLVAWTISDDYAEKRAKERFEYQIEEAQDAIQKRFVNYEQVLLGGLGLFRASSLVERKEWHEYISTLQINKFFPGTLGVGYSLWLTPDQLTGHIEDVQQQGFPNFTVRPEGARESYSSIVYLEPFNERNQRAFGYDMYSEPVRREAMTRARDSGKTAVSGKVTLVQETNSGVQAGFLIYVPHYSQEANTVEERSDALVGFIYSALRIGDLMQGILGVGLPELDFAIYDGFAINKNNLLHDSNVQTQSTRNNYQSRFQQLQIVTVGGHTWTTDYRTNSTFDTATSTSQPALVATGGIIIDFLLFNIILSLSRLRKRAQALADERMKKLRERELQFKAITDNANDAIISIDEQEKISYVNSSAQLLFGYATNMIVGKPITMLFPIAAQPVVKEAFDIKHIDNEVHYSNNLLELEGINRNSKVFPLEFSLAHWQSGNKTHFTAIVRDVTERKKIERIKSEFVSTISHELRTPLTAINGSLTLIENGVTGTVNEKTLGLITNANRNAKRLAALVNELLDTEKMASGTMKYDMQECGVTELINKALEINEPVAKQSNISLSFSEQVSVSVYVDPNRFIQIMTNLLANAIKFSPTNSTIKTSVQLINDEVKIAITDHGSGIPKEFRSKIFNKFAQADSSDTRKHGGTGLGLSIVKLIIEEFKGRIDYTSIPDKETIFFFFIPIIKLD
ncbi:MAG: PAS domain S-box protein [Gammaproteobacteria bacterium]|nr:PAS domain S-box protein [Gammaproteobacteria bacterium]